MPEDFFAESPLFLKRLFSGGFTRVSAQEDASLRSKSKTPPITRGLSRYQSFPIAPLIVRDLTQDRLPDATRKLLHFRARVLQIFIAPIGEFPKSVAFVPAVDDMIAQRVSPLQESLQMRRTRKRVRPRFDQLRAPRSRQVIRNRLATGLPAELIEHRVSRFEQFFENHGQHFATFVFLFQPFRSRVVMGKVSVSHPGQASRSTANQQFFHPPRKKRPQSLGFGVVFTVWVQTHPRRFD